MDKVKIQEIADEVGLSNGDLLGKAKELGFNVKAANSTISMEYAGILVDYAISGTLPKWFNKPGSKVKIKVVKKQNTEEQNVVRVRRGITIINKEKELTSVKKLNSNTHGIVDTVGLSKELEKKEIITSEVNKSNIEKRKNQHFLNLIKCSYEKSNDSEFNYLKVILTPMDLLKSDERFKRAQLYQLGNQKINLNIMYDRFHEDDDKSLEVYYDQIFIGHVRKLFNKEKIDKTNIVNEFCFDENRFKDIKMYWDGESFIILNKKQASKDKLENVTNEVQYKKEIRDSVYW